MSEQNYNEFIKRLSHISSCSLPKPLLGLIQHTDLLDITQYILTDITLKNQLLALKPYEGIRIVKDHSKKLKRTIGIACAPDGELHCILETKSKLSSGNKQKVKAKEGAKKYVKPAWRLDGENGPMPYVSMVVPITAEQNPSVLKKSNVKKYIEDTRKEVAFPWEKVRHKNLQRSVMGAVYGNKKGFHISIYAPQGIPLSDIKDHNIILTPDDLKQITLQLLEGLNATHSKGFLHQDVKGDNVLLFWDEYGNIIARYNDFEAVHGHEYVYDAVGSVDYESPEIAFAHAKKDAKHYKYFAKAYKESGKTFGKIEADKLEEKLKTQCSKAQISVLRREYALPHPANDVWALGVLLYELYHPGETPDEAPEEPLLKLMLEPDRNKRISIEEALAFYKKQLAPVSAGPSYTPYYQTWSNDRSDSKQEKTLESIKQQATQFGNGCFHLVSYMLHQCVNFLKDSFRLDEPNQAVTSSTKIRSKLK